MQLPLPGAVPVVGAAAVLLGAAVVASFTRRCKAPFCAPEGSPVLQGLRLGTLGWMMGQVPLWLLWYAEQPWPGLLVVKQLGLELLSSLIVGLTIAAVAAQTGKATGS
jgi:hypothetical protein